MKDRELEFKKKYKTNKCGVEVESTAPYSDRRETVKKRSRLRNKVKWM